MNWNRKLVVNVSDLRKRTSVSRSKIRVFVNFFIEEEEKEEEEFYSWSSKRKRDEITREILVTIVSRDNIDRGLERN